jgi:hypothetical protein
MSGKTAPSPGSGDPLRLFMGSESASGREESRKDRPALVFTLAVRSGDGATELLVVAMTHAAPRVPEYFCIKTSNISDQGLFTHTITILCQNPM